MNIQKNELEDFFTRLQALEADKKAIADEMKDSVASFASTFDITKKSVNRAYKEWKEANKDRDEYVLVDAEADQLLLIAFPEFAPADKEAE